MPHSKIPEFDRQLVGQEKGLNALTIDEYLTGREAFISGDVKRNIPRSRNARAQFALKLERDAAQELSHKGYSLDESQKMARRISESKMKVLAALHNPDLISGGKDVIDDFGDRQVNSSIGPQWKSRVNYLDQAVSSYVSNAGSNFGLDEKLELINASLKRCK
jgi:hypothetical protein